MPKSTIRLTDVENARRALEQAPDPSVDEINKRDAVRALADPIHAAQRRGYRLEAIAELLAKNGITISLVLLRKYLGEASTSTASRKKRRKPAARSTTNTPQAPKESSSPSTAAPSPEPAQDPVVTTIATRPRISEETRPGPAPIPSKHHASEPIAPSPMRSDAPPVKPTAPTSPPPASPRRSSFTPRKDTEDI